MSGPEPWISAEEAAVHLGFTRETFYKLAQDRDSPVPLPVHRLNQRTIRCRRSELDKWVRDRDAYVREQKKEEGTDGE